jgi:hypothetical protein
MTDNDEHVDIGERQAKGARSVGFVWILAASVAAAVAVLALIWAFSTIWLHPADQRGGHGGIAPADAANFHAPG